MVPDCSSLRGSELGLESFCKLGFCPCRNVVQSLSAERMLEMGLHYEATSSSMGSGFLEPKKRAAMADTAAASEMSLSLVPGSPQWC